MLRLRVPPDHQRRASREREPRSICFSAPVLMFWRGPIMTTSKAAGLSSFIANVASKSRLRAVRGEPHLGAEVGYFPAKRVVPVRDRHPCWLEE